MCHSCLRKERRLVPVSYRIAKFARSQNELTVKQYIMSSTNPAVTSNRMWPDPFLIIGLMPAQGGVFFPMTEIMIEQAYVNQLQNASAPTLSSYYIR